MSDGQQQVDFKAFEKLMTALPPFLKLTGKGM